MSKYISLDWLVEYYFNEDVDYYGKYVREDLLSEDTPSIDIVHCKDCKHNPKYTKDFQWGRCVCTREDDLFSYEPRDDFFCGYGERKDNE